MKKKIVRAVSLLMQQRMAWLILIVTASAGIVFLLSTAAYGKPVPKDDVDKSALIDCYNETFTSIGESHPNKNKVHVDKKLTWHLFGEEGTRVDIVFQEDGSGCIPKSPFDPGVQLTKHIKDSQKLDHLTSGKVLKGMAPPNPGEVNCYSYIFTCTPKNYTGTSVSKSGDPIIDVPH